MPRLTILYVCATLCLATTATAQSIDATQGARFLAISKGDDVTIGHPFDTVTGQLLGAESCLEGFTEFSDSEDAGDFEKKLLEVNTTLGIMRALNIDVSASGRLFGSQVTGKMGFAKAVELNQTDLSYTLFATYQAAPRKIKKSDDGGIRLKQVALDKINASEADFRASCGDAFIRTIFRGAEAYAVLSFSSVDETTRQNISAGMSASGANWNFDGKVDNTVNEASSKRTLSIVFNQTGGTANSDATSASPPAEIEWEKLKKSVESINQTTNVVKTGYMVVPYESLLNWPQDKSLKPSPDLLKLAYYRAAYGTLNNTVTKLVKAPQAAEFTHVLGRNRGDGAGDQDTLSTLQTDIQTATETVGQLYKACYDWKVDNAEPACASDAALAASLHDSVPAPYSFMTRLPLQMVTIRDAFQTGDALAEALFQQNLVFARNGYCDQASMQGLKHPACVSVPDLRAAHYGELRANVTDIWYPAPGGYQFRSQFRRNATCLTAHEKKDNDRRLFMRTCSSEPQKAKQRFVWAETGQLRIRDRECVAAPEKKGPGVSPHDCIQKEAQQLWRFIPLKRDANSSKPGVSGVLQDAAFGRCLQFGTPNSGKLTYVRSENCDLEHAAQHWTYSPK
jgi:hypothetical protein